MKITECTPFTGKICRIFYIVPVGTHIGTTKKKKEIHLTGLIKDFSYNRTYQEFEMCFYIGEPLPRKDFNSGDYVLKVHKVTRIKELSPSESIIFKLRNNV